jgi:cytoskeletal protein CcmA (bactofilin family)
MKLIVKVSILMMVALLALIPFGAAQAKELPGAPIFGQNFTLKSGETLKDDLLVFGGSVTIEKDAVLDGSIVLMGGSLKVDGNVTGDVSIIGGAVSLGEASHIHGNLSALGAPISRAEGAIVDGDYVSNPEPPTRPEPAVTPSLPFSTYVIDPVVKTFNVFVQAVGMALVTLLLALFLSQYVRRVSDVIVEKPLPAFGMGFLTVVLYIAAVIALALLSIFIITIFITVPAIVLISLMLVMGCLLGWIAMGMEIGSRLFGLFKHEVPQPLTAAVGVFVLTLVVQGISILPHLEWLSGLISSLFAFAGLGAVFMTRFGTRPLSGTATPVPVASTAPAENI